MSKKKRALVMFAKGGHSQVDVPAIVGCSKRDVNECARFLRDSGMRVDELEAMSETDVATVFNAPPRQRDSSHLEVDVPALVMRKSINTRLTIKLMWTENCEVVSAARKLTCLYLWFCEVFSEEAKRSGASARFVHEFGQKACVDWALSVNAGKAKPISRNGEEPTRRKPSKRLMI